MGTTVIHNAKLLTPSRRRGHGYVIIRDGVIAQVAEGEPPTTDAHTVIDARGRWLAPGFIDVHVNGGGGGDAADGDPDALTTMLRLHARHGTTAMLPTVVTSPGPQTRQALAAAATVMARQRQDPVGLARVLGVHLEGPYISQEYRGAHDPDVVRRPDLTELQGWVASYPDVVRMVTLAPEEPGALEMIRWLAGTGIIPAIGHTAATYEEARQAVAAGARFAVHCFNAMRGFGHREPGTAGAVLDLNDIATEFIPDGLHVHPAALRLLLRARGPENVAICTDAMRAAGLGDGTYHLASMTVTVRGGEARTADGRLAGSTLTMDKAVYKTKELLGIPLETAVAMATTTPARIAGVESHKGSLAPGKDADLVIFDDEVKVALTMVEGEIVYRSDSL